MSRFLRNQRIAIFIVCAFAPLLSDAQPSMFMGPKNPCVSDIHSAAGSGNVVEMGRLLDRGGDPNSRACAYSPPIFWAVGSEKIEMIKYLVKRGANVNAREMQDQPDIQLKMSNNTPLLSACRRGAYSRHGLTTSKNHVAVMRALIELGAEVNAVDTGPTPMSVICWDVESLTILAAHGSNLNSDPDQLFTRVIGYSIAAADAVWGLGVRPNLDKVAVHFLRYNIGVPQRSQGKLSENAQGWDVPVVEILEFLKNHGFSPKSAQAKGSQLVHLTILSRDTSLLEWFLQNGADPNERDESGGVPLTALAQAHHHPAADLRVRAAMLISRGANLDISFGPGRQSLWHPICTAAYSGTSSIIDLLAGVSRVRTIDCNGKSPIEMANGSKSAERREDFERTIDLLRANGFS